MVSHNALYSCWVYRLLSCLLECFNNFGFLLVATKENSITWNLLFNWQLYKADLSSQRLQRKRRTVCVTCVSISVFCVYRCINVKVP